MEILSVYQVFSDIVIFYFVIFLLLVGITTFILQNSESNKINSVTMGVFVFLTVFLTFASMTSKVDEYKVIVHDWNEVYKNGYEVTGIDGKIVKLRKIEE